jgi:nucleotide-binding universal stress UspA family protein
MLGSVAEEAIRRSPVPVVTVNPHVQLGARFHPREIFVPIELSDMGAPRLPSLELAVRLARVFGARVVACHVVEEWIYPMVQSASLLAGGVVFPLERQLIEVANQRRDRLEQLVAPFAGAQIEARVLERAPAVAEAILDEARSAGLVVMSHRRASRLEYAFLGSVTRQIVREANCPVVTTSPAPIM